VQTLRLQGFGGAGVGHRGARLAVGLSALLHLVGGAVGQLGERRGGGGAPGQRVAHELGDQPTWPASSRSRTASSEAAPISEFRTRTLWSRYESDKPGTNEASQSDTFAISAPISDRSTP
jgi:hypothetical protein